MVRVDTTELEALADLKRRGFRLAVIERLPGRSVQLWEKIPAKEKEEEENENS